MDSVEQFIDNPGLSHIGKQILSFLEVDDLWILRQVSKKWKIMADADLKKLKDYCIQLDFEWCKKYNHTEDDFWRCRRVFWRKRGLCNYMKFIQFTEKNINEFQHRFWFPISPLSWCVREQNIEGIKLCLPGCPYYTGTQKEIELELLELARDAVFLIDRTDPFGVALVNVVLDHCNGINFDRKDKYVQTTFVFSCFRGHVEVVKRLLEVSEEEGIDLNVNVNGTNGITEACDGQFEIVEILIEAARDKGIIDLTRKNERGWHGLRVAEESGEDDIVELLIEAIGSDAWEDQDLVVDLSKLDYKKFSLI